MTNSSNKILYEKALELRVRNKSYSQINKKLKISKSTLSGWLSGLKWSKNISEKLANNSKEKSRKNIPLMNKRRLEIMTDRHNLYIKDARDQFKVLKLNPLFVAGICLYWGEGSKREVDKVALINTDSNLIKVIALFYRKILHVPENKLRVGLFIYDDINKEDALFYWSRVTNIPKEQFIKVQVLKSRSSLRFRRIQNGICNIYFSSTEYSIKMREWTRLLAEDMRE